LQIGQSSVQGLRPASEAQKQHHETWDRQYKECEKMELEGQRHDPVELELLQHRHDALDDLREEDDEGLTFNSGGRCRGGLQKMGRVTVQLLYSFRRPPSNIRLARRFPPSYPECRGRGRPWCATPSALAANLRYYNLNNAADTIMREEENNFKQAKRGNVRAFMNSLIELQCSRGDCWKGAAAADIYKEYGL
jgi:hypothetical protein